MNFKGVPSVSQDPWCRNITSLSFPITQKVRRSMKGFRPGIRVGVGWGKSRFQRWEDTRPLDKSYRCVSKLGDFSPIDMAIWQYGNFFIGQVMLNRCSSIIFSNETRGLLIRSWHFYFFIQVARLKIVLSKRSSRLVCVDRQWTWTKSTEPLESHLLIGYPKRISVWVASTGDANELNSF